MLARRQDNYWWHQARRKLSIALLRKHGLPPRVRWLDVGCGPGGNLGTLVSWQPDLVVGLDLSPLALSLAQQHGAAAALVRADIGRNLPFIDESFGVVTIFNVLYHDWVGDEVAVLTETLRVLQPGGLLLITEPAFPSIAREMDVAAMGRRRYRGRQFDIMLRQAGFSILHGSYFTSFGMPILLAMNRLRHRTQSGPAPDMRPLPPFANRLLRAVATLEASAISMGLRMPFGTTLIRVCRRPVTA